MMEATTINERRLIPGAMSGGIGLPQAPQDDTHCLQGVVSHAWILGDPWYGRHATIHPNLCWDQIAEGYSVPNTGEMQR
jgi:hypothetical protein